MLRMKHACMSIYIYIYIFKIICIQFEGLDNVKFRLMDLDKKS